MALSLEARLLVTLIKERIEFHRLSAEEHGRADIAKGLDQALSTLDSTMREWDVSWDRQTPGRE